MINKQEFKNLILEHQKWMQRIDYVSDVLNQANLFECDWVEYGSILFDQTLGFLFTEEGIDDINWWIYEKDGRSDMKMWDKDGTEIPTETLDDLWNIVKDYRK
jgi:hypothetical protein